MTAQGITYRASFAEASHYFPSYDFAAEALEFTIFPTTGPAEPVSLDARVGLTIIDIIAGRFRQNPRAVVCYVCDQADARAFKRAMRFARLFERGNAEGELLRADVEQPPMYASILFRRDHPARAEIERAARELVGKVSDEEE